MQMIRQYAIPHDQVVQVTVPKEFNNRQVEIQIILVEEPKKKAKPKKKSGLGHLVGKYKHYTDEQNAKMDQEIKELRDSWERPIS
jgi:ssRNA-specific RNase YbeY (16S rRNA maturation enzyme)